MPEAGKFGNARVYSGNVEMCVHVKHTHFKVVGVCVLEVFFGVFLYV